jgi:nitrate/nitrite transport system substrate-binding protein
MTGTAAGVAAGGAILAACGSDDNKEAQGSTATTRTGPLRKVKLGFIALTDCSSLVMAKELGYFEELGLDVTIEKQASWPATRDALLNNQIDGAHCLFGMPFATAVGLGGGVPSRALKIAMILNNNGQAITLEKSLAAAGYANLEAAKEVLNAKNPTLAMTFPGGTHDLWLRYWLRATGADESKVKIIPIPPPQMVANMKANTMDGFCVGEPWGAQAVTDGIGFTHINTQDIWKHHPEKALVVGEKFATEQEDTLKDVMAAVLKASKWIDITSNRAKVATTTGTPEYVNALPTAIEARLKGNYDLGAGLGSKTYTDDKMTFFRDGLVNYPRRAYGYWFMAQYVRFGYLKAFPADAAAIVDSLILTDLYESVASAEKVDVPDDDMKPFDVKLDDITFDPAKASEEALRK